MGLSKAEREAARPEPSDYNQHIMRLAAQMNAALTAESAIAGFETEPRINLLRAIAMVLGIQAFCAGVDEAGMVVLEAVARQTYRSGEWVQ